MITWYKTIKFLKVGESVNKMWKLNWYTALSFICFLDHCPYHKSVRIECILVTPLSLVFQFLLPMQCFDRGGGDGGGRVYGPPIKPRGGKGGKVGGLVRGNITQGGFPLCPSPLHFCPSSLARIPLGVPWLVLLREQLKIRLSHSPS